MRTQLQAIYQKRLDNKEQSIQSLLRFHKLIIVANMHVIRLAPLFIILTSEE